MSGTVVVVPTRDRDLWLARVGAYAVEHGMAVVAVIASLGRGDTQARDAIADLFATGVVDTVLCAFRHDLPDPWPVVEASQPGGTRPTWRRPTVVDRAEPGPVQARPQVRTREAS